MSDLFGLDPSSYSIAINLFVRLLGVIYIIAYIPFLFQIRGLFGANGILPIASYLHFITRGFGKKRFFALPTLFWCNASDTALLILLWSGIVLGALLAFGITSPLLLVLLYMIHLSLTNAGQDFLSFGWETYLMELTVAAFLITATTPLNIFGWLGFGVLLLRFHVQAGASKLLSHDPNWRNLTALWYHYFTQPLPNTTAWYFQKFPMWFHKLSALIMFYAELLVPWFIFAPPEMRLFTFTQLVGLQLSIYLTGNLSYLNHLTAVSCVPLLYNRYLEPFFDPVTFGEPSHPLWYGIISIIGAIYFILQLINLWNYFFRRPLFQRILAFFYPYHICYPHGIFAIMTTKRYEIIIEGSHDGKNWQEYQYFYKPGDLSHRPRRIAPYQPRIDWQAWFLPFSYFQDEVWFQRLLVKILEGEPTVTKLFKFNPFPNTPPKFVRALQYDYEFTTSQERKETGNWWKRNLINEFAPSMQLITQ